MRRHETRVQQLLDEILESGRTPERSCASALSRSCCRKSASAGSKFASSRRN